MFIKADQTPFLTCHMAFVNLYAYGFGRYLTFIIGDLHFSSWHTCELFILPITVFKTRASLTFIMTSGS